MIARCLKVQLHRILIRAIVMYRRETWTPLIFEQNKLLIFERIVLKRIFEFYRNKEIGKRGWKIKENDKLKQFVPDARYKVGNQKETTPMGPVMHGKRKECWYV